MFSNSVRITRCYINVMPYYIVSLLRMLKRVVVVTLFASVLILYNCSQEQEIHSIMADKKEGTMADGESGSIDKTALLGEYLSTSTYILRNMKSHQLKPGECVPILEHLQKDLASTVTSLRNSVAASDLSRDDIARATTYLSKVDGVLQEMPTFLSILKKYPKGNADLDKFIPGILGEFTRLTANLGSVLNKSSVNVTDVPTLGSRF